MREYDVNTNLVSTSLSQPSGAPAQRGVALVMALIFLLILSLLGIGAMNTTALEEKMAFNAKDRNLAFQAAETALKIGENWIGTQLGAPTDFPNNTIGLYDQSATATPVWDSVTWTGTSNLVVYPNTPTQTVTGSLGKVSTQPKYIIEYMGQVQPAGGSLTITNTTANTLHYYRITSRGTGGTDVSVAMVQSTFSRGP